MSSRPNILWIQTDEQRPDSLASYGSAWARTPHTDRLAAAGTVFRNCVCQSPVCVPSRISQLACEYPQECHTLMNEVHYADAVLPEGLTTFPEVFAQAGYRTANIGKWHTPNHPTWQENTHIENLLQYAGFFGLHKDYDEAAHEVIKRPGGPAVILAGRYPVADGNPSQQITDLGIRFLREHDRSRPFLLRISHLWPHTPVLCPPPWNRHYDPDDIAIRHFDERAYRGRAAYDRLIADTHRVRDLSDEQVRQVWRDYMGLCAYVDHELGRLLDTLDDGGLRDNTIVVFSADHGKGLGEWGATEKGFFDAEVWRVPCIWSWTGHLPEGRIDPSLCELIDTGGTLLRLAGLEDRRPERWRGRDLFRDRAPEAVFGQVGWPRTDAPLFAHARLWRPQPPPKRGLLRMAVRTERYRMDVTWMRDGRQMTGADLDGNLFDLRDDPGEIDNRFESPAHRGIVNDLLGHIERWWRGMKRPADIFEA